MRQHPLIGSMMIMQRLPESLEVKDAVAAHHERWDGKATRLSCSAGRSRYWPGSWRWPTPTRP